MLRYGLVRVRALARTYQLKRVPALAAEGSLLGVTAMGAGELHLGLVDYFVGLRVLLRILTSLIPQLLAAFELPLRRAGIDLFRLDCVLRQDRHPVGQHFYKSLHHEILLISTHAAVQSHFAYANSANTEQARKAPPYSPTSMEARPHRVFVDQDLIRRHQPDLQLIA